MNVRLAIEAIKSDGTTYRVTLGFGLQVSLLLMVAAIVRML